ncbi:thiamine biosynthesis protein ThiJ [Streptomyces agglomeratus]|uniref:Thiamine biosynthesis protein ThiJ n=1 Tax=Streptomyces agglomeratus TaxID=285458 RepID=A0A1E5PFK5_9ACTN|nr:type 1 glutamine amidotransferase domain-containing protein [Streptomyces agglomeratus]OEJ28275.1 thiamine biosynthesis protein ThiJ [Streptomyces agglomeratus]OEJ50199.1 thiamine biosynthesis protein ThiJ [Streptomyces agglomeratus]OEJ57528.1 thiamine biosynthesis protein ThiJ [Streptomyces agglomeratus]
MSNILFVVTGADHWTLADGTRHPTGFWAEEVVAPYEVFTGAGHEVVVATPGGVVPTVDKASLAPEVTGGPEGADRIVRALASFTRLQQPLRLEDVDLADYDAVFYPGGHGPMEDLAVDAVSGRLLADALGSGKPLGVVCHAPAALLAAEDADGGSPFAGYRLTGFTNAEEAQAGLADRAKWLLQDRLTELGADFSEGEPWAPYTVVDRNLYTGQNPASSGPLAEKMLAALRG